ncbi:MAG: hypothetical protein VXX48_10430, partial [Pseudomonadota bacterium]|nr:hypothetical protein [Pseudomonadota bacterium]
SANPYIVISAKNAISATAMRLNIRNHPERHCGRPNEQWMYGDLSLVPAFRTSFKADHTNVTE